jgi:predicted Zn finger-like uncharacterized protein
MSLITRCPGCNTLFRVVQDQLRISEGWARCGQCDEVFNAADGLVEEGPPKEIRQVDANQEKTCISSAGHADEINEIQGMTGSPALPLDLGTGDPSTGRTPSPHIEMSIQLPAGEAPYMPSPTIERFGSNVESPEPVPFFLSNVPRPSMWHRTWTRIVLVCLFLALFMTLALQAMVHERDRIAALFPKTRPAVMWVCRQIGCSVGALRRIESIVIDGSSFSKVQDDHYRLSLVVRNLSALEISMPWLELTLTDSLDRPVMRRVFMPAELGMASTLLQAQGEWSGNALLAIRTSSSGDSFNGYRVLAFYP